MADARRPIHLGVIVGLSAGAYAVSLAGVTGLQSARDAATAAARAPDSEIAARLDALDADLQRRVAAAGAAYNASTAAYSDLVAGLGVLDGQLRSLTGAVHSIEGTSLSLPTGVASPHASKAGPAARPGAQPAVGAPAAPPLVVAPPRVAPVAVAPPTHATTGASGH